MGSLTTLQGLLIKVQSHLQFTQLLRLCELTIDLWVVLYNCDWFDYCDFNARNGSHNHPRNRKGLICCRCGWTIKPEQDKKLN